MINSSIGVVAAAALAWSLTAGAQIQSRSVNAVFVGEGAGAVPRSYEDKALDTVNVKDYGAKCDGATDDRESIQKAFDRAKARAGAVEFPPDTCRIVIPS